jgi:two-component system, cell cycle response regulator DivK
MTTVLLVEDDPNNVSFLEDIFQYDDIPAKLVSVPTGEEAMRCAGHVQPALILMDLRLPGIDGLETAHTLRNGPLTRDIPIWAISAYAMQGDEERALAAGCCRYITKPINAKDFADQLRTFLSAHPEQTAKLCTILES